ncbi:MAG: serine/threonine protein kinase [Planctomycetes bacterium]|nr:serine/threonine protein kinase [Planctomycetota bacterium]
MMPLPKIPGYELLTCLGGGVTTTVYSARECDTDFPCAIKVLRPGWEGHPVAVKLLQREARAGLAVKHPQLVRILDAHVLTPPHYLVMEHLAGESLRRRMRRDYSLDQTCALWIARQNAEALAALHRKGFIHADIKPENIRLVHVGSAILLDLGYAHRPGENSAFHDKGYLLGTVNYLAPELCGSEPDDNLRSDIFSLGVSLFEMLTGQLPYPAGTPLETMRRHRSDDPMLLTDCLPSASAALTELIDRMLSRDLADRPSAERLVQELIACEIASLSRSKPLAA